MNKIFKVLWDATSQQFVVTSELGKSKGKTKSVKTALVTAVGVATFATSAQAADYATTVIDGVAGQSDAYAGVASVAIGSALPYTNAQGETSTTKATAPLAIAIGLGATAAKSATLPADSTNPTNPNFADPLAAVAIGASSVASGYTSVAYGYRARATDRAAVAVGPDARAAGYASTAIGNGSYAKDMSTTALGNYAYAEGFQAVAVGASRHAEGLKATGTQSILLGTSDNADLSQDELMGPGYVNGANPWSEYTGTDLGTAQPTVAESRSSIVSGKNALGIGVAVKSTAEQAIAQGYYANASSKDSIAIGTLTKTGVDAVDSVAVGPRSSITSTKSNAFGSVNTITGANSTAIGNNNVIASEKVMVLGNNVNVTTGFDSAVVLGDSSAVKAAVAVASYTYAGTTYDFAGAKPTSVVSVGDDGAERQIVNVAAGQISNTSTDAINGSQLYALGTALETQINNVSWNVNSTKVEGSVKSSVKGDTTASKVKAGDTVNINAGNNIEITRNGNTVAVATSMTPTFTSVQVGGETGPVISSDDEGNVKIAKADGKSPAKITNVAAGTADNDAVNVGQLKGVTNNLNNKIDNVDQRASRGIAVAGAIGMLPQPHISGKSMVAAATTNYRGEQAVAVGYSRLSDNGKHIIKLSGSSNLAGKKDAMVGASYGYQW